MIDDLLISMAGMVFTADEADILITTIHERTIEFRVSGEGDDE